MSGNQRTFISAEPYSPLALAAEITDDAVDMAVLNAFEELQIDDGSDLIVELIDLYLKELPERFTNICEASIETDWVLLKRAAHSLKGSSANLGVRQVAEICQKLEWMDRHDSPQTVAALVRLLEYESAMASAALAAERKRRVA
jgi:HPt (histidine-containing phosphotransfer) domain-containing protein